MGLKRVDVALVITMFKHSRESHLSLALSKKPWVDGLEITDLPLLKVWSLYNPFKILWANLVSVLILWCPAMNAGLKHSFNNQPTNQSTFTACLWEPTNVLYRWKMNPLHKFPIQWLPLLFCQYLINLSLNNFSYCWQIISNYYLWFPIPTYHLLIMVLNASVSNFL